MDVKEVTTANDIVLTGGIFFTLLETSAAVDVEFYGQNGTRQYLAEGVEGGFSVENAPDKPFIKIIIKPTGSTTVKFGHSQDGRGSFNQFSGNVSLVTPSGGITTTADVNATAATALLLAANGSRKEVILTNVGGVDTRIGDSNTGSARGILLKAGGILVLTTTAAIYGYAASNNAIGIAEIS